MPWLNGMIWIESKQSFWRDYQAAVFLLREVWLMKMLLCFEIRLCSFSEWAYHKAEGMPLVKSTIFFLVPAEVHSLKSGILLSNSSTC